MRLATRLAKVEAMLQSDKGEPRLLILFEDDGVWLDVKGEPVDRETIAPMTQVVVFQLRPDGPQ